MRILLSLLVAALAAATGSPASASTRAAPIVWSVADIVELNTKPAGSSSQSTVSGGAGNGTYTFTVQGALPAGITLRTEVSGGRQYATFECVCTTSMLSAPVTIRVTSGAETLDRTLRFRVIPHVTIVDSSLPRARKGVPYSYQLSATGGEGGLRWGWWSGPGSIPPGFTLSESGLISGTGGQEGVWTFAVWATSAVGNSVDTRYLSLLVNDTILITTDTILPTADPSGAYRIQFTATGATLPHIWGVNGVLPSGLAISRDGVLSGQAQTPGDYRFLIWVTGSGASTGYSRTERYFYLRVITPLAITSQESRRQGTAGAPYTDTLTAVGGAGAHTWSLVGASLPPGLALAGNGVVSGTPTTAGTYSYVARVTSGSGLVDRTFTVVIAPALSITSATTRPWGTVGTVYSDQLTASASSSPAWSVTAGALPPGLAMDAAGRISGTPTTAGSYTYTATAAVAGGSSSQSFTVTIHQPLTLLGSGARREGRVGIAYADTLRATGGTGAYSWSLVWGSLPPGIALSSAGHVSGTPTSAGTYSFATSTASVPQAIAGNFSIVVHPAFAITADSVRPFAVVGTPYSDQLTASTGEGVAWTLVSGALPAGFSLSGTGGITGSSTQAGTFRYTVRATAAGVDDSRTFVLVVYEPLVIGAEASRPIGRVGAAYADTLRATGGSGSYRWSLGSGALPAGLSLSGAGVVTGTPAAEGTFAYTATVASGPLSTTRSFSVEVRPAFAITSDASRPPGIVGRAYSDRLVAEGAGATVTWGVVQGSLPPGLELAASTGAITGTPTAPGTYVFAVSAASGEATATAQLTLAVVLPLSITTGVERTPAFVGMAYRDQLEATGGSESTRWSVAAGELPVGLSLSVTGVISGTPTRTGSFEFTARVSSPPQEATRSFRTVVHAPVVITTESPLGVGETGVPYRQALVATGGDASYRWSVASGVLPEGLSLSESGVLSGSPQVAGEYEAVLRCASAGMAVTRTFGIVVYSALSISSDSVRPVGVVGRPYRDRLQATGGSGSAAWRIAEGQLPAGLALSPEGDIAGTPSATGSYSFSVSATSATLVRTRRFSLRVVPPLVIQTDSVLRPGVVGAPYQDTLRASGGGGEPRWRLVEGKFPAGIQLDSVAGVLRGVPEEQGESTVTLVVAVGGLEARGRFGISVRAPELQPDAVVEQLLGTGSLTQEQTRYLDLQGNRNGKLDVGDVRAWLLRTGQVSPVRIPGLP